MTTTPRPTTAPLLYTYDLTVEAITPLHVGNGETLLRDYDFVIHGDEFIVLDIDRVYGHLMNAVSESQWGDIFARKLSDIMTSDIARHPRLARYPRMRLAPGVEGRDFQDVRACIRTAGGEAYLPGSSLKGAIRTAFATGYAADQGEVWMSEHLDKVVNGRGRREFAAQAIDRDVFGSTPQADVMRAIRPSDLYVRTEADPADARHVDRNVELVETRVTKRNGATKAKIVVEAFRAGTVLDGTLTVDADPVKHLDAPRLAKWGGLASKVAFDAVTFLNDHAAALIDREILYHARTAIATEYVALKRRMESLGEGSGMMWVGWGTGWEAKTYGEALTASPAFPQLHSAFRLATAGHNPEAFPETRRLVFAKDRPVRPMGWAVVTITPRGER